MRRNASAETVYQASELAAATYYGKPIRCYDVDANNAQIGFKLVAPSANFVGSVAFAINVEDDGDYANWPIANFGLLLSVAPAQITLTTGVLAFATGLGAGTQRGVIRLASPPPVIVPRFIYTSGGGAYDFTLKAVY